MKNRKNTVMLQGRNFPEIIEEEEKEYDDDFKLDESLSFSENQSNNQQQLAVLNPTLNV